MVRQFLSVWDDDPGSLLRTSSPPTHAQESVLPGRLQPSASFRSSVARAQGLDSVPGTQHASRLQVAYVASVPWLCFPQVAAQRGGGRQGSLCMWQQIWAIDFHLFPAQMIQAGCCWGWGRRGGSLAF